MGSPCFFQEKVAHSMINKVKTDEMAVAKTAKILKILTDQVTTNRMPLTNNLKKDLIADALVDVTVNTIQEALKQNGIVQDSRTRYNTRAKKQKK